MRLRLFTFVLLSLTAAAYLVGRLEIRTSIVDFLPDDEQSQLLRIARDLSSAPQSRVAVFTLSAENDELHRAAARKLGAALLASGQLAWLRGGLAGSDQEAFYQLFFPARLGLVGLDDGAGPVPDELLGERVRALKERLGSPLGALTRELAPRDPLGMFEEFVQRQASAQGELTLVDGQLVTRDGRWSVFFAELNASPFDADGQARFEGLLERELSRLRQDHRGLKLEWSSVGRFARAAEHSIRSDIERISAWSMVGIMLLYLAVFRSLREPLLVILPIAFGSLLAVAVCQLLFGFVHGLSLAFGSSVIGVAEDFSTHYFSHRREASPEEDNEALMRRLWPAMLLGGVTTIVGVLSLLASGFPGLSQMAVFGAVGIIGALLATRYMLPMLTKRPAEARKPARARNSLLRLLARHRLLSALLLILPGVLLAAGLPMLKFQDGVAALRTSTPALDAENARVQARLGRGTSAGRVVVALGTDDEQALQRSEQVAERLARIPEALNGEPRSVTQLLPSVRTQSARRDRLAGDPTFAGRLEQVLRDEEFVPEAFVGLYEDLARPPELVRPRSLLTSKLGDLIAPFRVQMAGQVAYLTPVGTQHPEQVAAALAGLAGVHFVDQEALFSAAYGRFRERALGLLSWGVLLVLATLFVRYRRLGLSLLGMLPSLLGASAALGTLGLLGVPVSFMNVIAVLLVLSMGVDYGIYALEARDDDTEAAATLGSVLLASLTTVLSFGLLGISDNPALASIGLTVALGLLFCVLASPVVLVFARRRP